MSHEALRPEFDELIEPFVVAFQVEGKVIVGVYFDTDYGVRSPLQVVAGGGYAILFKDGALGADKEPRKEVDDVKIVLSRNEVLAVKTTRGF